jgi:hypothetical protein
MKDIRVNSERYLVCRNFRKTVTQVLKGLRGVRDDSNRVGTNHGFPRLSIDSRPEERHMGALVEDEVRAPGAMKGIFSLYHSGSTMRSPVTKRTSLAGIIFVRFSN